MNCRICDSTETARVFSVQGGREMQWDYWQCLNCCLIWMWPQPDPSFLSRCYDAGYYGDERSKFVPWIERYRDFYRRRKARMVRELVGGTEGTLLDLGCGGGEFLACAQKMGFRIHGIEFAGIAADRAAQVEGLHLRVGDVCTLGLEHDQYDAVTLWHVLEHISDPTELLQKCLQSLHAEGALVLDVPNGDSLQAQWFKNNWFHLDPPRHLFQFSETSVKAALSKVGFVDVRCQRLHEDMGLFGFLQSILNWLTRRPNALYDSLKTMRPEPKAILGWAYHHVAMVALAIVCLPLAMIGTAVESLVKKQAVLRVTARKKSVSGSRNRHR